MSNKYILQVVWYVISNLVVYVQWERENDDSTGAADRKYRNSAGGWLHLEKIWPERDSEFKVSEVRN